MTQWKLVPVEPTPEMLKAGAHYTSAIHARGFYQDMLNAAPAPDVQPVAWRYKVPTNTKWLVSELPPEQAEEWNIIVDEQPLYTHPPAADVAELLNFVEEYIYAYESGMAGESYLHRIAKAAIAKATGGKA